MSTTDLTVVFSDGGTAKLIGDPADPQLWIAVAEQLPQDDPTVWVEYIEDADGNLIEY